MLSYKRFRQSNIIFTADKDRSAFINLCRNDIQNPLFAGRSRAARLFNQIRHRIQFIKKTELSLRRSLQMGIKKNPLPFDQNLIDIRYKAAAVAQLRPLLFEIADKLFCPGRIFIALPAR